MPRFRFEAIDVSPAATVDSTAPLHIAHCPFEIRLKTNRKQTVKNTPLNFFITLQI